MSPPPDRSDEAAELPPPGGLPRDDGVGAAGKYEVFGRIGAGGLGVVLRGRDPELGRPVALKFLKRGHRNDPAALQRFVEEAQIGGQLEHPGIAPVYDLGVEAGRPFFAMKLIQGRTLAELLAERDSVHADRRRFLDLFEGVCQTVAYAHSRGVVHRDLKPGNVMVGTFGEVQVVDWGLAKVLDRPGDPGAPGPAEPVDTVRSATTAFGTTSVAGEVLGTPDYMAPEQARGESETVDERVDVYGLGAMLCEILTGRPPRAAAGALAASDADAELAELCRACLAERREDRPRDASAVAARVGGYLHSVEERAQAARLEAAAQRARAGSERRARRLTIGLAVSVLATVALGVAGWLWREAEIRQRREAGEQKIRAALDDATLHRGQGNWPEAVAAARRARDLVGDDTGAVVRGAVVRQVAEIEAAAADAAVARELRAGAARLLRALEDVRQPEGARVYEADWARVAADYEATFAAAGLTPLVDSVTGAVGELRARGEPVALASHLVAWSNAAALAGEDHAARLVRLADELDPAPARVELRRAIAGGDIVRLRELAAREEFARGDPVSLGLLGAALRAGGAHATALELYRRAQRAAPDDFFLNLGLARTLWQLGRKAEAVRYHQAALAARPTSTEVRHELGRTLQEVGENADALRLFDDLLAQRPDDGHVWFHLAYCRDRTGDVEGALAAYREAIRLGEDVAAAHGNSAAILMRQRDHLGAVSELRAALQHGFELRYHFDLALCLTRAGESATVIAEYEALAEREPDFGPWHLMAGMGHHSLGEIAAATAAYRAALAADPDDRHGTNSRASNLLAQCLRSAGELHESLAAIQNSLRLEPNDFTALRVAIDLHLRLDDPEAAEPLLERFVGLRPDEAESHARLGRLRTKRGAFAAARPVLARAVELDAELGDAHADLGRCHAELDEPEAALRHLRRAIELGVDDPELAGLIRRLEAGR